MRSILTHEKGGRLIIGPYPTPAYMLSINPGLCINLCTQEEINKYGSYKEIVLEEIDTEQKPQFIHFPMDMKLKYSDTDIDKWSEIISLVRDSILQGKTCFVHDASCSDRVKVFSTCVLIFYDDYSTIHNTLVKVDDTYKYKPNLRLISILTRIRHDIRSSKL